jgi:hypothetical protein
MNPHFAFYTLFTAAFLAGSPDSSALAEKARSFRPLTDAVCESGTPVPTSKLFNLIKLEVPFLTIKDGPEMLAVQAIQCLNPRPDNIEGSFIVLGHRANDTTTFFVASIRGELFQAARGQTIDSGEVLFVKVELNDEIRCDFETAKAFWLDW